MSHPPTQSVLSSDPHLIDMLNFRVIIGILGAILLAYGIVLLIPMFVGLAAGEENWWSFGGAAVLGITLGVAGWNSYRPPDEIKVRDSFINLMGSEVKREATFVDRFEEMRVREAFVILAVTFLSLSLLGALPFVWSGVLHSYSDAFFETMSGFTGTGATILSAGGNPKPEALPAAFLFWRAFTQWLGGLGMIILATALLPMLGIGGMQLFKGEVSGPAIKRISFRFKEVTKRVWGLYMLFTVIQIMLLLPGMSFLDAMTHAFSTISTGGFSTKTESFKAYNSVYLEFVTIPFMLLGAINFNFIYQFFVNRDTTVLKRQVLVMFFSLIGIATILITLSIYRPVAENFPPLQLYRPEYKMYDDFFTAFRYGFFQVVSIATTTGFSNESMVGWIPFTFVVFFFLSIIGGMAGSTAGGVKIMRILLLFKQIYREMLLLIHPKAIIAIRLEKEIIPQEIIRNVTSFIFVYFASLLAGTALMSLTCGLNLIEATGVVVSSLSGIGPPLQYIDGTFNGSYALMPVWGKWILSMLMLMGRVEIFTFLILFMPHYWKR